jgi:hypothetical protein
MFMHTQSAHSSLGSFPCPNHSILSPGQEQRAPANSATAEAIHRRIDLLPPNAFVGQRPTILELLKARLLPNSKLSHLNVNTGVERSIGNGGGTKLYVKVTKYVNLTREEEA